MKITTKLWLGLGVLIILSPLGLFLPEHFLAGPAWGEWGAEEMKELVGYIPRGLEKLAAFWNAPIPDYAFRSWKQKDLSHLSFDYIISAIIGILITIIAVFLLGKILAKKGD